MLSFLSVFKESSITKNSIKLNKNENPYHFSKNILKALDKFNLDDLRFYQNKNRTLLSETLAYNLGLNTENILPTNGTYEAFVYIFNALIGKTKNVYLPSPIQKMYEDITKISGNKFHILDHEDDYTLNLSNVVNTKNSVLILTNPNSLTGMSISIKDIDNFLSEYQGLLIINETYTIFSGDTAINLIKKYDNVIITRSISISHSLPSVRLSFIISNEEIIKKIDKVTPPHNISTLTEVIAIEALKDTKTTLINTVNIIKLRKELISNLSKLGFIVMPSKSNFILAKSILVSNFELFQYLEKENIFIRYFEDTTLKDWLRISVGSEKDNSILISKIKHFIKLYQD